MLVSKGDLGTSCCGASVGSAGKICVRSNCSTKSHLGSFDPVFADLSQHGQLLLVSSGSSNFVYSQPNLDASMLPTDVVE